MRAKTPRVIDMAPQTKLELTAADYLNYVKANSEQVKRVRFIAPTIGGNGFGKFEVDLNNPIYSYNK